MSSTRHEDQTNPEEPVPDTEKPESPLELPEKIPSKAPSPAISPIVNRSNGEVPSVVTEHDEEGRPENTSSDPDPEKSESPLGLPDKTPYKPPSPAINRSNREVLSVVTKHEEEGRPENTYSDPDPEKPESPLGLPDKTPYKPPSLAIYPVVNPLNREELSAVTIYEDTGRPENTSSGLDPEKPESPLGLPEKTLSKPPSPAISPIGNRLNLEEFSVATRYEKGRPGNITSSNGYRSSRATPSILRRRDEMVRRSGLGFRVCGLVFSFVSFSVMAADKTQGWAGDSFYRYKQYRYCISVTILAFVYSGFQVCRRISQIVTGKDIIRRPISYYFDFTMDQVFTYLLISASSSAATRTDDWVSNWGDDKFTAMASASVAMSFLAFAALALSCLISGYNLCNHYL